jgi:hypothetical protein
MTDSTKIRGISPSTWLPSLAYKPTSRRIFRKTEGKPPLRRMSMIFDRCAARCRASLTSSSLRLHPNYGELALPSF